MSEPKITAVVCDALSYSGTTWLNLVLGTHPDALALGPPHRVWRLREENFETACLIHGKACEFWPAFGEQWDGEEKFFPALHAFSGRTHYLMDNPAQDFFDEQINIPGIEVKRLRYVRDGRAITASKARKDDSKTYYESIQPGAWFYHSFMNIPAPETAGIPYYKYEDIAQNTLPLIKEISDYIGLSPEGVNHKFWEGDHHLTSGNGGPMNMVRLHQGLKMSNFESRDVYEAQYKRLVDDPDNSFFDERWRRQLTREDLFHFDLLMGEQNAKLGYERDTFTDVEVKEFWERYGYEAHMGERPKLPDPVMFEGQTRYNEAVERMGNQATVSEETAAPLEDVVDPDADSLTEAAHTPVMETPAEEDTDAEPADAPAAQPTEVPAADVAQHAPAAEVAQAQLASGKLKGHANALAYFKAMEHKLPPSDTDLTHTTYFSDVDAEKLAKKKPYKVEPSTWDDDYLRLAVNLNVFQAYGPAYEHKVTLSVGMDTLLRYGEILRKLKAHPNVVFRTFSDALNNPPEGDEICVLIRHDVDGDIFGAVDMAEIEDRLGVKSSYYLLHTAPYYAVRDGDVYKRHEASLPYYRRLQELGQEVGLHTDSLTLLQYENIRGDDAVVEELRWLRENGIKVEGTLAHNSFGVYGANNFTQFKHRPSELITMGDAVAVEHRGQWSPLRQLDEEELGLTYEGNDVLWQDHTPLDYYSLVNQGWWRCVLDYYGIVNVPEHRPLHRDRLVGKTYATVIDEVLALKGPRYVMLICHPLANGMRASIETPMETHKRAFGDHALAAICGEQVFEGTSSHEKVVESDQHDPVILRWGIADGRAEYLSLACKNDQGQEDRPYDMIKGEDVRIVSIGRSNFAGRSVLMDSRFPQMVVRDLRVRLKNRVQIGGTSFCFDDVDKNVIRDVLGSLPETALPQLLFVGLNARDADGFGKGSYVQYLNNLDRIAIPVIGVVELSGLTEEEAMAAHAQVAGKLRDYCHFPIVDPYDGFAAYKGQERLYRQSVTEWTELGHDIAADLAAQAAQHIVRQMGGHELNPARLAKL